MPDDYSGIDKAPVLGEVQAMSDAGSLRPATPTSSSAPTPIEAAAAAPAAGAGGAVGEGGGQSVGLIGD